MKIVFLIIYSISIVGAIHLGRRYIHADFGYYMVAGMLILWIGFKALETVSNKKLARILAKLSEEEREEHLSPLSKGHKKSVNALIKKQIEKDRIEK